MTTSLRSRVQGVARILLALVALGATTSLPAAGQGKLERAGDVVMRVFPVANLATTLAIGDYKGSEQFLVGFAATAGVTEGLKLLVPKSRPDGSDEESFPSGHTSIAFHSATFLHLRYGPEYGIPAYAAAAMVGLSRTHARKHFVEDVLVGMGIGILGALAFTDERHPEDDTPGLALGLQATFGGGFATRITGGILGLGR